MQAGCDRVPATLGEGTAPASLAYELDAALKPIRHAYLGDPAQAALATAAVAQQGKKA